ESKVELLAGVDDFFDHLAQLIDFDGENTPILAFVAKLGDGVLKSSVDRFNPVTQQVLKPDNEGETEPAGPCFVDYLENLNRPALFLERRCYNIAIGIDCKITTTPSIDVVSRKGGLEVPIVFHLLNRAAAIPHAHFGSATKTFKQ